MTHHNTNTPHYTSLHMAKKSIIFKRTANHLEATISALRSSGKRFDVLHSSYSTAIRFPDGNSIKFTTFGYRDKVFAASRCIISDLEKNRDRSAIINERIWPTNNFDSRNGWNPKRCKAVINIDISKAYATCLLNSGLISEKTFRFLNQLKKHERLPAVGMIAKRTLCYRYNQGECISFTQENAKWTNIFFYIISQVNSVMHDCQMIAGQYYCFHWVDGIFLDHNIDKHTLQAVETCLMDAGYSYKYEKVEDFRAFRDGERIIVTMVKNGIDKQYCYRDPNFNRNYRAIIESISGANLHHGEETAPNQDSIQLY